MLNDWWISMGMPFHWIIFQMERVGTRPEKVPLRIFQGEQGHFHSFWDFWAYLLATSHDRTSYNVDTLMKPTEEERTYPAMIKKQSWFTDSFFPSQEISIQHIRGDASLAYRVGCVSRQADQAAVSHHKELYEKHVHVTAQFQAALASARKEARLHLGIEWRTLTEKTAFLEEFIIFRVHVCIFGDVAKMTKRESEDRQRWQVFDGSAMILSHDRDLYITRGAGGKYSWNASGKTWYSNIFTAWKSTKNMCKPNWLRFGWLGPVDWCNLRWHPVSPCFSFGWKEFWLGGNVLSDGHPFVATLLNHDPFAVVSGLQRLRILYLQLVAVFFEPMQLNIIHLNITMHKHHFLFDSKLNF